ncbi:DNA adenine methylase [Mucilaginibacter aquariorum]|uniref:Site-specific DNA-methyltransferase (adenine-specific) n=1 Tax=Mucilaginibacter aquariorum TaxID=2967225 RepID=A0ABT1T3S5_9SPHI|nr:Dam family site-specific DNA-(adenine-N6)-methyltransferase [Mucilaginibacter aquariorum]MCQ6958598.1 Dam family site-specific DNA-(adenine-N6)-methyltransferase [Mucilaginibacter aquariorum]
MKINVNPPVKPFLRWAGGKSWLIKHLYQYLPKEGFNNYHEPFLGGASIFFHLHPEKSFLSDLNNDLIETYITVKNNVEEVIKEISKFENTEAFYYSIRHQQFDNDAKKAAQFIYLNQTSFNGIYRVNLRGVYNVPFGYRSKNFYEPDVLRSASQALANAELSNVDFKKSIDNIKANDLVFLDPPYTVTHNNNGFIKYNKNLFDLDSQYALSNYIDQIKDLGAYYILTNAAHHQIEEIFKKENDQILRLDRASLIGGRNAKRGKYAELVITNIV